MGVDLGQFDGPVDESLICPLCSKVLESPVRGRCGHTFCAPCLQSAARRGRDCTKCGGALGTGSVESSDSVEEALALRLAKLSIRCTLGCDEVMEYGQLPRHTQEDCPHRTVGCEHRGCGVQCSLSELAEHMETCDYRLVECKVSATSS